MSLRGSSLAFGDYGLKAITEAWITASQLDAARHTIAHNLRKGGRVWMRVFPDKPVSARPAGKRMGSGKGEVAKHVAVVRPGRILFEVAGAEAETVRIALKNAAAKLPVRTEIIEKNL